MVRESFDFRTPLNRVIKLTIKSHSNLFLMPQDRRVFYQTGQGNRGLISRQRVCSRLTGGKKRNENAAKFSKSESSNVYELRQHFIHFLLIDERETNDVKHIMTESSFYK